MSKTRAFVSFDPYHDKYLKYLLDTQVILLGLPVELAHWSVQRYITEDWTSEVRKRIKNTDLLIVICSKHTASAKGVSRELEIAQEEEKPYFLLWRRKGETCERPNTAQYSDEIYRWTSKNLKKLLAGERDLPIALNIDKKIVENLVNKALDKSSYGLDTKYQDHLLEQYKLYVEITDRNSSKWQKTNTFFFSINTALISLFGYFNIFDTSGSHLADFFSHWIISIVGIMLNYRWIMFISFCERVSNTKFKIINEIEKFLPLYIYDVEWGTLKRGERLKSYSPFTHIGSTISRMFFILYMGVYLWKPFEINILPIIKDILSMIHELIRS